MGEKKIPQVDRIKKAIATVEVRTKCSMESILELSKWNRRKRCDEDDVI
jgi:hypothetical protein